MPQSCWGWSGFGARGAQVLAIYSNLYETVRIGIVSVGFVRA